MALRDLREESETHYSDYKPVAKPSEYVSYKRTVKFIPYIVSGGTCTERFYFRHISDDKSNDFEFIINPKYNGDESDYRKKFPSRIKKILASDSDALIFCLLDLDNIHSSKWNNKPNYVSFIEEIQPLIDKGNVVMCESMPCFEYWILLHYIDYTGKLKRCSQVEKLLRENSDLSSIFPKCKLKSEKLLEDSGWIRSLCKDGRFESAVIRAKSNYAKISKQYEQAIIDAISLKKRFELAKDNEDIDIFYKLKSDYEKALDLIQTNSSFSKVFLAFNSY